MSTNDFRSIWIAVVALVIGSFPCAAIAQETVTVKEVETAGINGLHWDKTYPGARTVDAVHRGVLVRFPQAAGKIAEVVKKGASVEKVELVLAYDGYEVKPRHYIQRNRKADWKNPPRWHVVGWMLRRPWEASEQWGPTFNASIKGLGFWTRFGASDPAEDRYPRRFGPAELSEENSTCRLNLTATLTSPVYGERLGQRLRRLAEQGVLLKKWEVWDQRYDEYWSAYEWAKATGGHGLRFKEPRLVVTLTDGSKQQVELPDPTDFTDERRRLRTEMAGDATAVMPSPDELKKLVQNNKVKQPDWMPDWQWKRVKELKEHGGGSIGRWSEWLESGDPRQYRKLVQNILKTVPRYWKGWGIQDDLLLWYVYGDMLPEPVRAHIRAYWRAWLMPGMPTDRFFHPQSKQNLKYYKETGDWRGRKSFFRAGYNYTISTMNFNHTAAMGALLGGDIIDSQRAKADGRHGLEYLPMRLWAWYDGTTQESIDHYYYAITLSAQKMFADFGPRHLDRLMGQSILAKSVGELTSSYHPALRHFINTSGRTGISYLWVIQDGLQHIIHTLSRDGALHDMQNEERHGMPRFGHDVAPARVALQSLEQPWAPEWAVNIVDEKPIPFHMTTAGMEWGHFRDTPLWKKVYMGENYGVSSLDVARNGSVPLMMQWRRGQDKVERVQQLGTLLARMTSDGYNLLTTKGGGGLLDAGNMVSLQEENKLVMLTSPLHRLPDADPKTTKSLQTTVGLFTLQDSPTWTLYVDGEPVEDYPVQLEAGRLITLHDGVSYVGLIPVPAKDLGRTDELLITDDTSERKLQGGGKAAPTLLIHSYNYKSDETLAQAGLSRDEIDMAYGGFVMEIGDQSEYGSFDAFQNHMENAVLETEWNKEDQALEVAYESGDDLMEMGFKPSYQIYKNKAIPTDECFTYRRVNGEWPYLPDGILRDNNLAIQGTTGKLEKNGATLRSEYGRMGYLQTEPISGTVAGWNPLPDPTIWSLKLPDGGAIRADGRVGLLRVIAGDGGRRLEVDHARKYQAPVGQAHALLLFGMGNRPVVQLNGKAYAGEMPEVELNGEKAYVLPLDRRTAEEAVVGLEERYAGAQAVLDKEYKPRFLHDWHVIGPFPHKGGATLWTREANHYPPEKDIDLDARYEGFERVDGEEKPIEVKWQHTLDREGEILGEGPLDFTGYFDTVKRGVAYAYTEISSDQERDVTLYTGSDQRLTVWVNGEKVLRRFVYRAAAPDQDRTNIHLKKGKNHVLVRSANGWEGWSFFFRLGDEYGLPVAEGLEYGVRAGGE